MQPITRNTVSVVIPCFNQARYLTAAVESVRRQTHQPLETIVVDDGSADETVRVASQLGVRVLTQANTGVSGARNTGLAAACGEFVVFLDADDELLPEALEFGVATLRSEAGAAAAVGRCQPIDEVGQLLSSQHDAHDNANLYHEWLVDNFVWTPGAAMFRREALAAIGGFPATLGPAADYAVYLQLARAGRIVHRPRDLVRYRQHGASMSRDLPLMLRSTLAVLRRERRAAPPSFRAEIRRGERVWRARYGEALLEVLCRDWRAGACSVVHVKLAAAVFRYSTAFILDRMAMRLRRQVGSASRIRGAHERPPAP